MSDATTRTERLLRRVRALGLAPKVDVGAPLDEASLRALLEPLRSSTSERPRADSVRGRAGRVRERVARAWSATLARLSRDAPFSDDNTVEVYCDGDVAFEEMLEAIARADRRVWFETYIFADDPLGRRVRDALVDARARGVEVTLLYDAFGSNDLDEGFFAPLVAAGGRVVAFNPVALFARGPTRQIALPLTLRDHRKILVVDDARAFAGGMNVSADYAGKKLGNARFRDTHLSVTGTAARDLARTFVESFARATGERLVVGEAPRASGGTTVAQVLRADPWSSRRQIQRALRRALSRAVSRAWVTTPYFVPPRTLLGALCRAARRGVDVRVLTAGDSDVPIVRLASWHFYDRLLASGVRVFELEARTLHAKTTTIDGLYGTVGSFNLDHWSHRRLLEVNVAMVDGAHARALETQFVHDLEGAREVTRERLAHRSVFARVLAWLAALVVRI